MSLTTQYVRDSRQIIAGVEAADITNPDLPRPTVAALITRSTEMLRTMGDHAERLNESLTGLQAENTGLRAENIELENQVRDLRRVRAETQAAA